MSFPKVSFGETLGRFVTPTICNGCASCVVVYPYESLEYVDEAPRLTKECKSCGICAQICPKYNLSVPLLEQFTFGRERKETEEFGVYRQIVIARTTNNDIRNVCQDGGIVTTLLTFALENAIIDGAILSGLSEKEPLRAVPKLATNLREIMECAGTRYTYSPNILALKEGVQQRKKSVAFVGTPCHINAVRMAQKLPLKKYAGILSFTIGLFCSECFTYEGLVKRLIGEKMGIAPREVKKINVKGKMLITTKAGETKTVSLKEAKEYARPCFSSCTDFSAELADISAGGLGLNGWTLTLLRTQKGVDLFRKAESEGLIRTRPFNEEDAKILEMLVKFSRMKHENLTKTVSHL
ncbi:MAG: Coenzyme F420 hydrogenase/dehydrogenase, beta subunit C-terminal domain [Nitrososphaerota archaeon]